MFGLLSDSPEYEQRKKMPFTPPKATLADIHAAIPKHLYEKSTLKGLGYVARDAFFACLLYRLGRSIDPVAHSLVADYGPGGAIAGGVVKWTLWVTYWHWQGVVLAGWWCLGHEAGHGTLSPHAFVNTAVGYMLHTFLFVPYFSWRSSHRAHHRATSSIERDENYVPRTRSDYALPLRAHMTDYHDVFEDTPLYTLLRMLLMQAFGWQAYLLTNALGNPMYPVGTNHFQPSSALFRPHERRAIVLSNIGLATMATILAYYVTQVGFATFGKMYLIPYLLANHWIVMLTFLHHSDPTIPHYRSKQWTFLRGATATVDRPLLGWAGRFFLHNVSHDHIAHHLVSSVPFYNQPQVTAHIRRVLRGDYNYDSTNTFRALYRSFTECLFIEDEGDIVFYKNKDGVASRAVAPLVT